MIIGAKGSSLRGWFKLRFYGTTDRTVRYLYIFECVSKDTPHFM